MVRPNAAVNRLLLIHPDPVIRGGLARVAGRLQLEVRQVGSAAEATDILRHEPPFGVVAVASTAPTDPPGRMGPGDPLSALHALNGHTGPARIILVADAPLDPCQCSDAIKLGVVGFLDAANGVIDDETFAARIATARRAFEQTAATIPATPALSQPESDTLVWRSPVMAELLTKTARAAQVSDVPILVQGESGTGKQLLAELVHRLDPKRSGKRFLCVNCAAISGTLAESTLFGHVKGAFTGATESRKGHFRAADGGTILLDEIGEMDMALQPKLLHVLQEHLVMPVGADDDIPIDVRVIAATNRPLAALVEQGKFRLDLYQRLNVVTLEIPPLRDRPEDIPALVRFFLRKYAAYYERPIESVDDTVYQFLAQCSLHGNVRELENTVRQILAFKSSGVTLAIDDIPPALLKHANIKSRRRDDGPVLSEMAAAACRLIDSGDMTLPQLIDTCEKLILSNSLQHSAGTSGELARRLGLSRRTLYNKLHKYELPAPGRITTTDAPGLSDRAGYL